ncbi:hypothetical protein [Nocardioides lijunqiniae]|uniref:hypothetical protein n=1 Tax=Nocardioides lijunqiniae TaxID=2760832 RepID=UPI00187756EC|nr:hypothetical protein [Nocardioides lijunqiniae]
MPITYSEVVQWQAAPLGAAGDGLKTDVQALERSRDVVEAQGVPDSWTGIARLVAEARRDGLVASMTTHIEGKTRLQRAMYDAESQVTVIESLVQDVQGQAAAQELTIGSDGTVTDSRTPPTFDNRYEADEYRRSRTAQAQAIADDITTILGKAAAADMTIANAIPSGTVQDIDEYGTASPEVAEHWAGLTDAERRAIIEQQIQEMAEEYGIDMPTIEWQPESWESNGSWNEGSGTVSLNEGLLDDPRLLHTVAHEMRHARQHEAAEDEGAFHWPWETDPFAEHEEDGITEEQAREWEENFNDYQSTGEPGVTFEDYFEQPVEEDARDGGREYLDGLTTAELERLLEESR